MQSTHPPIPRQRAVHQHLLHSIAGCRVVQLGIYNDAAGHVHAALGVHIDVADSVGVAQHGNARVALDVADQSVAAARDDQVDHIIQLEQLIHTLTCGDEAYQIPPNLQVQAAMA